MTTAIKERPILFSGPMVRAILEGRKTQTRRVVTKQTSDLGSGRWEWLDLDAARTDLLWGVTPGLKVPTSKAPPEYCPECVIRLYPRIEPGDRLWVREAWAPLVYSNGKPPGSALRGPMRNPPPVMAHQRLAIAYRECDDDSPVDRWRPSIHMPRWASRLLLEVTEVRVERLQSANRGDCMAEGCPFPNMAAGPDPRDWFRELWDSINAFRGFGWDVDPWVWVVSFRRLEP